MQKTKRQRLLFTFKCDGDSAQEINFVTFHFIHPLCACNRFKANVVSLMITTDFSQFGNAIYNLHDKPQIRTHVAEVKIQRVIHFAKMPKGLVKVH